MWSYWRIFNEKYDLSLSRTEKRKTSKQCARDLTAKPRHVNTKMENYGEKQKKKQSFNPKGQSADCSQQLRNRYVRVLSISRVSFVSASTVSHIIRPTSFPLYIIYIYTAESIFFFYHLSYYAHYKHSTRKHVRSTSTFLFK